MKNKKSIEIGKIRHSAAHVMAQAVIDRFEKEGPVVLGGGPAIDDGFYFDFILPRAISENDLQWVEQRMKEIILEAPNFHKKILSENEARKQFANQPLKLELIDGILSRNLNEHGQPDGKGDVKISVYQHSSFSDLCAGPHVNHCGEIPMDGFKVHRIAGAYWQGDENKQMLQRIYALCFESKAQLQEHLKLLEEAKKRDHRKIGKELDLFFFSEHAPGMPYWLPNGLVIYEQLIKFWRKEHRKRGYQEISSPLIHHQDMWELSGHWEHFRDEMFLMENPKDPNRYLSLKPMNCPDAMVVFNHKKRSYKELPLRLADCNYLHRLEKSGSLHGLFRARRFAQDDAHIFLSFNQIEAEILAIFDLVDRFYAIFGLKYRFRLGLRPQKFIGKPEQWSLAEDILHQALESKFMPDQFEIEPGEGAFYGPKIDILIKDAFKREWQMGSIQLDFQLPSRFGCKYVNSKGQNEAPIVLHRVIYGSMERFIGILLEHYGGHLPVWLSPIQLAILPVSEQHLKRCEEISFECEQKEIRFEIMPPNDRISARIRQAERKKIPLIAVVGKKEIENESISLRKRGNKGQMSITFLDLLKEIND